MASGGLGEVGGSGVGGESATSDDDLNHPRPLRRPVRTLPALATLKMLAGRPVSMDDRGIASDEVDFAASESYRDIFPFDAALSRSFSSAFWALRVRAYSFEFM